MSEFLKRWNTRRRRWTKALRTHDYFITLGVSRLLPAITLMPRGRFRCPAGLSRCWCRRREMIWKRDLLF